MQTPSLRPKMLGKEMRENRQTKSSTRGVVVGGVNAERRALRSVGFSIETEQTEEVIRGERKRPGPRRLGGRRCCGA